LRSQRLESGPVFLLQRREPFQHLGHEGRAGIGRGPFDEALQGIADFLGLFDGGAARFSVR
jgi:hypothetical protein